MNRRISYRNLLLSGVNRGLKSAVPVILALCFLLSASSAVALIDLPIFGPKRYDRLKGKPTVYTDSFERCNPSVEAVVKITNGDAKDTPIKSGVIYINGVEIAVESDFKQQVGYFEKRVPINETNEVKVVLKSGMQDDPNATNVKNQSFLIIEIIGKDCDNTPPTISNPLPADGALLNTATPRIAVDYSDEPGGSGIDVNTAKMTVDGNDVTGSASVSVSEIVYTPSSNLPEGLHTVTANITDRAKNTSTLPWEFTTDTIPPSVKITSHQDQQYLNKQPITLSGTIDDSTATVTVNGRPAQNTGTGFTVADLQLTEGLNPVMVEARDPAGNIGRDTITINLDTVAPVVQITSHQNNQYLNTPQITVTGTVNEPVTSVTINGNTATLTGNNFSLTVSLAEGSNSVAVQAVDRAGNIGSQEIRINLDTVAPVIAITAPIDGSFVNTTGTTVSGTVTELNHAALWVNEAPVSLAGQDFTVNNFALIQGSNTITVRAADLAGNESTETVTLTLDTTPPSISITAPQNNVYLNTPAITVTGSIDEPVTSVKVNGYPAVFTGSGPNAGGSFSISSLPLAVEGANKITVEAKDRAENTGTASITVNLDTIVPVPQIVSPQPNIYVNATAIAVSGIVNEKIIEAKVNDIPAQIDESGTGYSLSSLALNEGTNTIAVSVKDRAGNPGTTSVQVTRDTIVPTVQITSHQTGTYVKTTAITISGTVSETDTTVTVNDTPAQVTGTTFTFPDLLLSEGENRITITATDRAGNAGTQTISVTRDTVAPVINVTTPIHNSYVKTAAIEVTGTVTEINPAGFWINDNPVDLTQGNFSLPGYNLDHGINVIRLRAKDLAENESTKSIFVTLDTTPPAVTISTPYEGAIVNTPQITVSGSVNETVTSVTVNGAAAQISGTSFSLAGHNLSEDANKITVDATDRAGNVGTSFVNIILDTQPPTVTLSAPGQAAAGANVGISVSAAENRGLTIVEVRANGAPIWSVTPNSELSTQNLFLYSISPDLAPGATVDLQAKAYDVAGNIGIANAQIQITQGPTGAGYIQGEVYDDTKGLRLEGATAEVLDADGRKSAQIVTPEDGTYFSELAAGNYFIQVVKEGFTPVERSVVVKPEKNSVAIDARLTPISTQQNILDSAGGKFVVPLSVPSVNSVANIEFDVSAGAIAGQADIRITPISNQGLAGLLPTGWSPIAAVDISAFTLNSELRTLNFDLPATLKVSLSSGPTITASSSVTFATYDRNSHQWIVREPGTVSGDGAFVTASIPSTGQYAFILADDVACASVVASALTQCGSTPNSELSTPNSLTASGKVVPPAAPPSKGLKAVGEVVLSPNASPLTPDGFLPSGLIITGRVTERFDLFSGEVVVPSEYEQDLVMYKYPCVTNAESMAQRAEGSSGSTLNTELGTPNSGKIGTSFPVMPSKEYTIKELMMGKVGIEVNLRAGDVSTGVMVGADGARLLDSDGNVLVIERDSLSQTVPVSTKTVAASNLSGIVGNDFTLLRAVEVDLTGRTLTSTAELSIPAPAGLNTGLPIIIAKLIDVKGAGKLKLVALARLSGSLVTSAVSSVPSVASSLSGITVSGQYFFLQAKSALGFIIGTVKDGSSKPYPSAQVTTSTCSLTDLTGPDGRYLVASTVAGFTLTASDIYKNDKGTRIDLITAANETKTLDVTINVTPPSVVSVVPANGATGVDPKTQIVITMSEAVRPESITSNIVYLEDSTGTKVPGVFSLSPDGTVITIYPGQNLASETAYTLTVGHGVQDLQGYFMGQDYVSHFTIKDTTPPMPPAAGSITATFPDADGYITITATQGSAEATGTVLIINDTTGEIVSVKPASNGSFTGKIMAMLGNEIKIVSMDASGNQTLITYITFKSDDGKYLVTAKGGIVEGEGGLKLEIPEGALLGPTVIKITPVTEAQLPQDNPMPQGGHFLAAVHIDAGGTKFQKEVKVSVPAPSGIPQGATLFIAQPSEIENADGTKEKVYTIVDNAKLVGNRLSTASFPFPGITEDGYAVFQYVDLQAVVIDGYLYRDVNQNNLYDKGTDIPIRNGVIRSPEMWNYIARTNNEGFYAAYSWAITNLGPGACNDYRLTAIDPLTQTTKTAEIKGLCKDPNQTPPRQNFAFPTKVPPTADREPPRIEIALGPQDAFTSGITAVGTQVEIEVRVRDNGDVDLGGTTLEITPAPAMGQPQLSYISTTAGGALVYKATFKAAVAGTCVVTARAKDLASPANTASRTATFAAVSQTNIPEPLPGPPSVSFYPSSGAANVMITAKPEITFSEPVTNVTASTATLWAIAADGAHQVGCGVASTYEGSRMKTTITPSGNLIYGTTYEIRLGPEIRDTDDPANPVPISASAFKTMEPDVYGLPQDQVFSGRDVAVLRDYAYETAGPGGWRVINIADPALPVVVYTENNTNLSHTWEYRGVAAQDNTPVTVDGFTAYRPVAAITQNITFFDRQFGMLRLYDVTSPNAPKVIGHEQLAIDFSGIPGRLALAGKYAYICNAGVGLQVVDLEKATASHNDGQAIVGYFDSWTAGYRSPRDVATLKGKLYLTTTTGHFLSLDASYPQYPQELGKKEPGADFYAWTLAVAGDFAYIDEFGTPKTIDIAVVASGKGKVYVLDITNPNAPALIGQTTENNIYATDIALDPARGMAFAGTTSGVALVDIKDPTHPRVTGVIANLGQNPAVAENNGILYLANQTQGLKIVTLDPGFLRLQCNDAEFPEVRIPCTDHYPGLGDKTIVIEGKSDKGLPLQGPARVRVLAPGGVIATPTTATFNGGLATLTIRAPQDFVGPDFKLDFRLENAESQFADPTYAGAGLGKTFRIRNNSNVILEEVLTGQAAFVNDCTYVGGTRTCGPAGITHAGTNDDRKKKFDYVQELLNQVVPRGRTLWSEPTHTWAPNNYTLIEEDGTFDVLTSSALRLFRLSYIMAGDPAWRIGDTDASFTYGAVNYNNDDNTTDTFRKLMKDYNHRGTVQESQDWVNKIIDKETLIGKNYRIPKLTEPLTADNADVLINRADNRHDTGLYELYENVVERFVNGMIKEAERYAGIRHSPDEEVPIDAWTSRMFSVYSSSTNTYYYGANDCTGISVPPCSAPHGDGMSYSNGGKQKIYDYNLAVSKWPGPVVFKVPTGDTGYKGKINEQMGQVDNINGTKMWAGLYQAELRQWNFHSGQWNDPKLWAGIDCMGFVLRTMRSASDSLVNSGISFPEVCIGDSCPEKAAIITEPPNGMDWTSVPKFAQDLKGKAHYFIDKDYYNKMRQGDVVFYPQDKHITIVWSERWGKSIYANAQYDVIQAFGYECEEDDEDDCNGELWFRKTGVTPNTHRGLNRHPYGFGRIMLWE